jgi:ABC-2 type transport system permease protein
VDRLRALIGLRLRLALRGYLRTRESLLALALALPGTLIFSGLTAGVLFLGVHGLSAARPEALVPLLSAGATLVGLMAVLGPLLSGVSLVETPDAARLAHFPVSLRTLMLATLVSNLLQPALLAQALPALAVAVALGGVGWRLPIALAGVALTQLAILAAAQAVGLLLYALARHRRLHDVLLLAGLPLGMVLGFVPFLLLGLGPGAVQTVVRFVSETDVCALSPFAWGIRAAAYGSRGEPAAAALNLALGVGAILAVLALSAVLAGRIQRSALAFRGWSTRRAGARRRPWLPGAVGALMEKDLRSAWRDPGLKATLLVGLIGPFVLLLLFSRGSTTLDPTMLLFFALFIGQSPFGSNALGFERRGIQLLLSFPVERWKLLTGKNAVQIVLRAPSLLLMGGALALLAPAALLPAAAATVAVVWLVAAGLDNLHSVLFPISTPAPGQNPTERTAGGRGLGAVLLAAACIPLIWLVAAPFVLLTWLPLWVDMPWLGLASLPLGLAGALGVHALLVAGAAHLFARREPQVVGRLLGDA